jgi:deoxycytidylate deaminase
LRYNEKLNKLRQVNLIVHVAVIVFRGKIIAEATNRIGHRREDSLAYNNTFIHGDKNLHAEENAIKKLGNYNKLRGSNMYIVKLGKKDAVIDNTYTYSNSKPCKKCECLLHKCMKKYGLKTVYYTC